MFIVDGIDEHNIFFLLPMMSCPIKSKNLTQKNDHFFYIELNFTDVCR